MERAACPNDVAEGGHACGSDGDIARRATDSIVIQRGQSHRSGGVQNQIRADRGRSVDLGSRPDRHLGGSGGGGTLESQVVANLGQVQGLLIHAEDADLAIERFKGTGPRERVGHAAAPTTGIGAAAGTERRRITSVPIGDVLVSSTVPIDIQGKDKTARSRSVRPDSQRSRRVVSDLHRIGRRSGRKGRIRANGARQFRGNGIGIVIGDDGGHLDRPVRGRSPGRNRRAAIIHIDPESHRTSGILQKNTLPIE